MPGGTIRHGFGAWSSPATSSAKSLGEGARMQGPGAHGGALGGGVRHRVRRGLHRGALHTMPVVFLRLLRDPGPQVHKHLGDVDVGGADLVAGPAQGSAYAGAARSARLAV